MVKEDFNEKVYRSPIVAVTNEHKLSGLKQKKYITVLEVSCLKSTCWQDCALFVFLGEFVSSSFQFLEDACIL